MLSEFMTAIYSFGDDKGVQSIAQQDSNRKEEQGVIDILQDRMNP
jgi:hypothetical protein